MGKKLLPLLIMILLTSGLSACSTNSGSVRATDQSVINKIKIGKTTKEEVRSLMGDTSNIMRHSNNEVWTYQYQQTDIGAKTFIPFANLVGESSVSVKISILIITFDANGIVQDVISNTSGNK